jgi:hypothetical protein
MIDYSKLPGSLAPGMERYIEQGIQPGSFLTAVVCNNLKESFMRADDFNQQLMFEIVSWMYNEAPMTCWGSPSRVRKWIGGFNQEIHERLPEFPE